MRHIKLFEDFELSEEEIENLKEILYYLSDDCGVDFKIKTGIKGQKIIFIFDNKREFTLQDYKGEITFDDKMKPILDILVKSFIESEIYFEMLMYITPIKASVRVDNSWSGLKNITLRKNHGEFIKEIKSLTELPDQILSYITIELKCYSKYQKKF